MNDYLEQHLNNNPQNKQPETSIQTAKNTEIDIPKINGKTLPVNAINNNPENIGENIISESNSFIENGVSTANNVVTGTNVIASIALIG